MTTTRRSDNGPNRLAIWYGKGGVGKSTTTILLSLLLARRGDRVLTIDLDPECGSSRDFLGGALRGVPNNLRTFLESPVPVPPTPIPSGIERLDIVPNLPDDQRFFRYFPEHSPKLRDGLDLLPAEYEWIIADVPNQYDNIAQLGLIAADWLLLPVELTADCQERTETALRTIAEARASNPRLRVLGALALASAPRSGRERQLTAKEHMVLRQYEESLARDGIRLFDTIMFRSATTVEEARSNADERLLHWTARRRFKRLLTEIITRVKTRPVSFPSPRHAHRNQPRRAPAAAVR